MEDQAAALARLVSVFKLDDAQPRLALAAPSGARTAAPVRQLAMAGEEC